MGSRLIFEDVRSITRVEDCQEAPGAELLVDELIDEHGEDEIGWEQPAAGGGYIDAVVGEGSARIIYEIKTAATVRGCVKEAMGQLLDDGCWPGSTMPAQLVVVGKPALDASMTAYLARLNASFPVPIAYWRVQIPSSGG